MIDSVQATFRRALAADWDYINALLADAELPSEDLGPDKLDSFIVAENEAGPVGLIGLQRFGTVGLLRSLVVGEAARGCGLGRNLVARLESAARSAGVAELWLLTIDAEQFFGRIGYQIVSRDKAPVGIQRTEEFSELCPGTAFLMTKILR